MLDLKELKNRIAGLRLPKWFRHVFLVLIVGFLFYQMSDIGWRDIFNSLPTHPLFYIIFFPLQFSLPIAEIFVYKISWHFRGYSIFGMLIKKRVLNQEVLGYSGELLVYTWGRKHVNLTDREILKTLRDNNILSSVATTSVAIGLLLFFTTSGELSITDLTGNPDVIYVVGATVILAVVVALAYHYRRFWFSMTAKTAVTVIAIYMVRQLIGMALQIAQWAFGLPEVGIPTWFTFAAASIILSRVPVVPNKDLIFVSAGIGLAGIMDMSSASVAGMLLVISAMRRVVNLVLFTVLSFTEKDRPLAMNGMLSADDLTRTIDETESPSPDDT